MEEFTREIHPLKMRFKREAHFAKMREMELIQMRERKKADDAESHSDNANRLLRRPPDGYSTLNEAQIDLAAFEQIKEFLKNGTSPVYVFGDVGLGKSFLAAYAFCRCKQTAKFIQFSDFVSEALRVSKDGRLQRYNESGFFCEVSESAWWHGWSASGLVVLDEIGVGISHQMRSELLWRLLEVRKDKPLIVTGNLSPAEIGEKFDDRIQSRFLAGALINFVGVDRRREGLNGRIVRVGG